MCERQMEVYRIQGVITLLPYGAAQHGIILIIKLNEDVAPAPVLQEADLPHHEEWEDKSKTLLMNIAESLLSGQTRLGQGFRNQASVSDLHQPPLQPLCILNVTPPFQSIVTKGDTQHQRKLWNLFFVSIIQVMDADRSN